MEINTIRSNNYSIIEISGRLDTTNYQELEKVLQESIDRNEINLILDCSKLNYVSSSGLRVFLMFLKKIRTVKGKFYLCCMQEDIMEIFRISGFSGIFDIFETKEQAIAAI